MNRLLIIILLIVVIIIIKSTIERSSDLIILYGATNSKKKHKATTNEERVCHLDTKKTQLPCLHSKEFIKKGGLVIKDVLRCVNSIFLFFQGLNNNEVR